MMGRLIVISGPSGVGKTTICARLLDRPEFRRVITATSRPPRPGERPGVDYRFLPEKEFLEAVKRGDFLEHARVHGHLYGTPRRAVDEGLAAGHLLLLNIDVQGARQIREAARGAPGLPLFSIFLEPPSIEELEKRLRNRGTEAPEAVAKRLETARRELAERDHYDLVVVNDSVENAVERIRRALNGPAHK